MLKKHESDCEVRAASCGLTRAERLQSDHPCPHSTWYPCRTAFISPASLPPPHSYGSLSYIHLPINLKPSSLFCICVAIRFFF